MNPPRGVNTLKRLVDYTLTNVMFALRATINSALNASLGSLAFSQNMILDLLMIADWQLIRD